MTEALESTNRFIFEKRNFHRIMANCAPDNNRSLALLDRLGFQKEGVAKKQVLMHNRWEDRIMMAMINPNWVTL